MLSLEEITKVKEELRHYNCTESYHRNSQFNSIYWTDGVQYYCSEINAWQVLKYINDINYLIKTSSINVIKDYYDSQINSNQLSMLKGIQFWHIKENIIYCQANLNCPKLFTIDNLCDNKIETTFYCQHYSDNHSIVLLQSEY